MTQAQTIYKFLAQTKNKAADKTLTLALRRAEEPYQMTILETILDAGRPEGTYELVACYHRYQPEWQSILANRTDDLHTGLRLAGDDNISQTRLNALDIIRKNCYPKLTDMVAMLLRDNDKRVADKAASSLLDITQSMTSKYQLDQNLLAPSTNITPTDPTTTKQRQEQRIFLQGLAAAVRNFPIHRRSEALIAAIQSTHADWPLFWRDTLEPYHPVGRNVRQLLNRLTHKEFAPFYITALRIPWLRPTVARSLAKSTRASFILAAANAFQSHDDQDIRSGLKLIRQPQWFDKQLLAPDQFDTNEQIALATLISALTVQPDQKIDYLCALAEAGNNQVCKMVAKNLEKTAASPEDPLVHRALNSPSERLVLAMLINLVRTRSPKLNSILIQQLASPHPRLRELARNHLKRTAFPQFWKNFDKLNPAQRRAAGNAVLKIDPETHKYCKKYLQSDTAEERLQAIRVVRLLNQVNHCLTELEILTNDPDTIISSSAIAALGQADNLTNTSEKQLINALDHQDPRVQANAIEAIEKRNLKTAAKKIAQLTNDDNNRVRANAIKTQLTWKVSAARQLVEKMVSDPRPEHQRSAHWLVNATNNPNPQFNLNRPANGPWHIPTIEEIQNAAPNH